MKGNVHVTQRNVRLILDFLRKYEYGKRIKSQYYIWWKRKYEHAFYKELQKNANLQSSDFSWLRKYHFGAYFQNNLKVKKRTSCLDQSKTSVRKL